MKKSYANSHFYLAIYNTLKKHQLYLQYYHYNFKDNIQESSLIFMVDGRLHHGGMADRFAGLCTSFALSKINHVPFHVNYIFPFNLEDFLLPNKYDWTIDKKKISYNKKNSFLAMSMGACFKSFKSNKQNHIYSNFWDIDYINKMHSTNFTLKNLFDELFKPAESLSIKLDLFTKEIGGRYIGVVFRFQQLLGDFVEGKFPVLKEQERELLKQNCYNKLRQISEENQDYRILVTSDSVTFLDFIKDINYVYIIPGDLVHMDYIGNADKSTYAKSFFDFYMLRNSIKIINVIGGGLMPSGFPLFAARSNNIPFERISL